MHISLVCDVTGPCIARVLLSRSVVSILWTNHKSENVSVMTLFSITPGGRTLGPMAQLPIDKPLHTLLQYAVTVRRLS